MSVSLGCNEKFFLALYLLRNSFGIFVTQGMKNSTEFIKLLIQNVKQERLQRYSLAYLPLFAA